ncbi:hypothetical protein IMZ31_19350 (plasmid) [Pontibacillus sp. ALD_SL1]|uniref:hypothetical protein n=1 Tax=Pontibacillus sp. ALD_SL1 TaxID=2777185 RepID=UPI001A978A53|nr:hypothetical protein [Pontibacillus sp. ALD_SL1]QST02707.1 hypothetical protein IMZ31_19350 [Pontibacillus sp. ALD_SL1]
MGKFSLGQVVMTAALAHHLEEKERGEEALLPFLKRHHSGDWGDLTPDDREQNEEALRHGDRLLSSYDFEGETIWIITEHDRSVTTMLFPSDY